MERALTRRFQSAAAWSAGRAMTLEQAIDYALQQETPAEEAPNSTSNLAPD